MGRRCAEIGFQASEEVHWASALRRKDCEWRPAGQWSGHGPAGSIAFDEMVRVVGVHFCQRLTALRGDLPKDSIDDSRRSSRGRRAAPCDGLVDRGMIRDAVEQQQLCGSPQQCRQDRVVLLVPCLSEMRLNDGPQGEPAGRDLSVNRGGQACIAVREAASIQ